MTERYLIFSAPMVRAILEGRKTVTRRPSDRYAKWKPGDLLHVKETFRGELIGHLPVIAYRATGDKDDLLAYPITLDQFDHIQPTKQMPVWRPSLFMPKWACRIVRPIVSVRQERLQDITDDDALAEGVNPNRYPGEPVGAFAELWAEIYGPSAWADNPMVRRIEFAKEMEVDK